MGSHRIIKIAILTSSRADFGYYIPLMKAIKARPDLFSYEIIAFGTHLSPFHGQTEVLFQDYGFEVNHRVVSMLLTDDEESISTSYALTALKFSAFWEKNKNSYDLVLCIGDRYEMAAAVAAGIPLGIRFAHFGGGDTTLGATDNIYRHAISLASVLHFVLLEHNAERVKQIAGENAKCVVTGALSLENLNDMHLLNKTEFKNIWGIDFNIPSVLITIHPETINSYNNLKHIKETIKALKMLVKDRQLIISMPNSDTAGSLFRHGFESLHQLFPEMVKLIENFGSRSYFSCMNHVDYMLGNTSSGIIEAASFGKFVVNIGDRQKGRLTSDNIIHVPFNSKAILEATLKVRNKKFKGNNIYKKEDAIQTIIDELKNDGIKDI
jgi:GDP/UDP-N,N'-diacetylbacillosamine 2-epimerase (hydrolysing)